MLITNNLNKKEIVNTSMVTHFDNNINNINTINTINNKLELCQKDIKELYNTYMQVNFKIKDIKDINDINEINDINYKCTNNKNTNEVKHRITKKKKDGEDSVLSVNNTSVNNINLITKYIANIIKLNTIKYVGEPYIKRDTLAFYNNLALAHSYVECKDLKPHIKYFLDLDALKRADMLQQITKISFDEVTYKPKIFKILESTMSDFHKKLVLYKLQNLETMQTNDSEYYKLSQWIDNILDIPFNIYKQPKYISNHPTKIFADARQQMDNVIYGQQKTKQHILEIIAKMISNPQTLGTVFAVEGEPGTGKTTLIKDGLSHVMGLPFIFISLGGAQDSSYLSGDNYTYIGSKCGKIIQALKEVKCLNPIFYFDELDKVSDTERGQEIINLLIHITDYSQNQHFLDYYMDGITIDLSRATFIFSFNDRQKICPILLDRMDIIKFHPYSIDEKKYIIEHHLFPSITKQYFNNKYIISFYNDIQKNIIFNNIINNNITLLNCIKWNLSNDLLHNTTNIILSMQEPDSIQYVVNKIHSNKNKKKN